MAANLLVELGSCVKSQMVALSSEETIRNVLLSGSKRRCRQSTVEWIDMEGKLMVEIGMFVKLLMVALPSEETIRNVLPSGSTRRCWQATVECIEYLATTPTVPGSPAEATMTRASKTTTVAPHPGPLALEASRTSARPSPALQATRPLREESLTGMLERPCRLTRPTAPTPPWAAPWRRSWWGTLRTRSPCFKCGVRQNLRWFV